MDFNINIALNIVLCLIMFGLGLSLTFKDFKNLFSQPKALAIGLITQMILLPGVALLLAEFNNFPPEYKLGIMILSFCPGGITSNLISYFVKGNVALAISLTVCNALVSIITIPLLVNISLDHFMNTQNNFSLPFWRTMFEIFIVTLLPAFLGVLVNYKFNSFSKKTEKYLNYILPFLLLLVFAAKFFGGKNPVAAHDILELTPLVVSLNVLSMILGFFAGNLFKLNFQNRITIAVEVGLHNTALALLIAGEKLQNSAMEKPALVYAMYSFFITFMVAWLLMRFKSILEKRK